MDQPRNPDFAYKDVPADVQLAVALAIAMYQVEDQESEESPEEQMGQVTRMDESQPVSDFSPLPPSCDTSKPSPLSTPCQSQLSLCHSASTANQRAVSQNSSRFSQTLSQVSENSDYFGGSRDYFGDSMFFGDSATDGFYGEDEPVVEDEFKLFGFTQKPSDQQLKPLPASTPSKKPLEQEKPAKTVGQTKAKSMVTKRGRGRPRSKLPETVEGIVEMQRQIHKQFNPASYEDDDDSLPATPPPSSPVADRPSPNSHRPFCDVPWSKKEARIKSGSVKKVVEPQQPQDAPLSPSTLDTRGLRRSLRARTSFKPFQPPASSPSSPKAQRPRKALKEFKGDRSAKAFWVRIVGIQLKWMRKMGGGTYSRPEVVSFARDSWQLLTQTFVSLDVKPRSQAMHRLVLTFLSNSIKMYELMTLKGFQEVYTMLPEFVRIVLKKFLSVPRRLYEQIPQWLQARDAITMICSHLTQNELILTILATVVDMQKGFLDTWTASASTPVDLNMDHVISGMQQIGELVTTINARMAQARRVDVYGLMF